MRLTPVRRAHTRGCLAAGMLWFVMGAAPAEGGDFYIGVTGSGERLDVLYDKTVDNTSPNNISLNPGEVFRADDSATKAAFGGGFLAGYRVPFGLTGVFVAGEGDLAQTSVRTNWRNAAGRLSGVIERAGELGSW